MSVSWFEVRLRLSVSHEPVSGAVIAIWDDGSETVWPSRPGPFDSPQEALEALLQPLDKQQAFVFPSQ